jgi:hypothetical protein
MLTLSATIAAEECDKVHGLRRERSGNQPSN